MKLLRQLYIRVLIGLALATVLGIAAPGVAVKMKPLGDGFIALLRTLLGPIVFVTVVHGMAGVKDMRKLGRLGAKSLLYFEVVSTLAILLAAVSANVFQPGVGLHAAVGDPPAAVATTAGNLSVVEFLLNLIPVTLVDAFAKGAILQILLISLLFGVALALTAKQDSLLLSGVGALQVILFKILGFIMRLAPLGAFGAMAAAIGNSGASTLVYLGKLVLVFYGTCLFFIFVILAVIARMSGISIFHVLKFMKEELLLVFGTASSEVAFPRLIEKLPQAGCDEAVVGFVLPAGYSFNLDGTGMYLAMTAVFIAQVTDTPFPWQQQLALFAVMLFTSKGGTTVAGAAFLKLGASLQSTAALPLGGMGILLGVDRFLTIALSLTNMIGNVVAVFAIARWENAFDPEKFRGYLDGRITSFPTAQPKEKEWEETVAGRRAADSSPTRAKIKA